MHHPRKQTFLNPTWNPVDLQEPRTEGKRDEASARGRISTHRAARRYTCIHVCRMCAVMVDVSTLMRMAVDAGYRQRQGGWKKYINPFVVAFPRNRHSQSTSI